MKCKKFFYSFLFVFLGLCSGSFIINQNLKTSAVSDITYTWDVDHQTTSRTFCSPPDCASYRFLYVSVSGVSSPSTAYFESRLNINNTYVDYYPNRIPLSSNSLFDLTGLNFYYLIIPYGSGNVSNFFSSNPDAVITITLSENNPFSSGAPSGSLSITENGTYDVTNYAEAVVEVPDTETIIQGDYHDDLVNIYKAILICGGLILVIYFFYCIYRMFIPTFGGKK